MVKQPAKSQVNKKLARKLTKRDGLILEHIAEFGMSTFDILHRKFFLGKKPDAVKSTLRRLGKKNHKLIASESLDGQRVYYRLTPKAGKLLAVNKSICCRYGPAATARRYALLWFSEGQIETRRRICRPRDFPQFFNIGDNRLPKVDFYLSDFFDKSVGESRFNFGLAIIDFNSHHRRVVDRAKRHLRRFLRLGWFNELIRARSFEISVLTVTQNKKRAINCALKRELLSSFRSELGKICDPLLEPFPIGWQVEVVPGLIDVIPGASIQAERTEEK